VEEEVNLTAAGIATEIQSENITLLNNSVRMLTDKEINQKIAFAAGITRNEGKMSVEFGEEEEEKEDERHEESMPDPKKPLNVDKEFILRHNLKFDPENIKGLPVFDSMFKADMRKRGWELPFTVDKVIRHDSLSRDSFYSEPFIFDFFDPVMYRINFKIPAGIIVKRILPEIITSLCIIVLLLGTFSFFYRSYKLQLQMSSFKESLFSNVTHELKSPLTSLRLIIDEANDTQPLSAEHRRYAQRELSRMSLLIEKILSFGKMSKEQIAMNKVLVDVGSAVRDAVEVQEIMIKRSNGCVNINVEEKAEVYADKALLTNVFITLLDNSLKYNNGIPQISVDIMRSGEEVKIAVADNGIGMDNVFLTKIFEPFFRIPDNDRHNVKGHGLGLSFVQQVIEMHGGSISVESVRGKGSVFFIQLPKA
jgi:signal transduction histidine kinase